MAKQLLEQKFVLFTRGFLVSALVLVLVALSPLMLEESGDVGIVLVVTWLILFAIILGFFLIYRKSQTLRVFDDRVEVRSRFLVESVKRIEASKLEAVDVKDSVLGQKAYGSIIITGSGGSKVVAMPIANHHEVVEIVRSISSAANQKNGAASASGDIAGQLANLDSLHKSGALTDDEYKAAKTKLLG